MLLHRLAEATGRLQRYIAGLDGHVEADAPTLDITVLLAQACARLETAGDALHDAARNIDDAHQASPGYDQPSTRESRDLSPTFGPA